MKAYLSTIAKGKTKGIVNIQINTRFSNLVRGIIPYKKGMVTFEASGRLDINHEQKTVRVEDLAVVQFTYSARQASELCPTILHEDPLLVTAALAETLTAYNDALYASYKDFEISVHHNASELAFAPTTCTGVVRLSVDDDMQSRLSLGLAVEHYEVSVDASYTIEGETVDEMAMAGLTIELQDYDLFGVVDDCYECTMTGDALPANMVDELTQRARPIIEEAFSDIKEMIINSKELARAV